MCARSLAQERDDREESVWCKRFVLHIHCTLGALELYRSIFICNGLFFSLVLPLVLCWFIFCSNGSSHITFYTHLPITSSRSFWATHRLMHTEAVRSKFNWKWQKNRMKSIAGDMKLQHKKEQKTPKNNRSHARCTKIRNWWTIIESDYAF